MHLPLSLQEKLTSRYLYVPPQGSPKTLLVAGTLQEERPWHLALTTFRELELLQLVLDMCVCWQRVLLSLP